MWHISNLFTHLQFICRIISHQQWTKHSRQLTDYLARCIVIFSPMSKWGKKNLIWSMNIRKNICYVGIYYTYIYFWKKHAGEKIAIRSLSNGNNFIFNFGSNEKKNINNFLKIFLSYLLRCSHISLPPHCFRFPFLK